MGKENRAAGQVYVYSACISSCYRYTERYGADSASSFTDVKNLPDLRSADKQHGAPAVISSFIV